MSLAAPYQEHYYVADGVTTSFAFGEDFTALSAANVKCIIYFEDGTNCVPTFTVDMTTGFITIVTLTKPDGTVLTVPPAGSVVRVFRDTPEQQNVTASQLQNYTAKQLERIFDSVVAMIQEVSYSDLHKTIRLTETQRDVSMEQLKEENDQAILYWDFETRQLKATDYGQNQVVKSDTVDRLVYLQPEGKIYFIPKGSNNPIAIGSATIHNDLGGRNAPDCHPESAITNLTTHLQELRDADTALAENVQTALNRSQEAKDTADEAKETAEYAQAIAGQAKDIAEDAKDIAEGIEDIAEEAKDTADEAKEIAQDAKDIAEGVVEDIEAVEEGLANHIADKANPHEVTKAQVGLGNVDNTSDLDKPISTATQTALDLKMPISTKYGAALSLTINSTTYVVTAQLKDQDGNNLGAAQTIDLPLESVVVSGSYDPDTKEVILVLENGSEIRFSVADLISGLQSEITAQNPLDADLVNDSTSAHKFVTATEKTNWNNHIASINNPHQVTKAQVGLGNVDNTSDLNKPISTATQTALNGKADVSALNAHINNTNNPHNVTKAQVGLDNVDNTSDLDKPISTATQTALDTKADETNLINGAPLSNTSSKFFGVSSTAAATVQKEVSIPSITSLEAGIVIIVQPTITSTVANSTLKLNSFDAYPMRYNNAAITTSTDSVVWSASFPSIWVFDGTYWVFAGHGLDSNTTYTLNYSVDAGQYTAGSGTYAVTRYSILAQKADGTWEKITATNANYSAGTSKSVNTSGFILNQLRYYGTTTAVAGGVKIAANVMYEKAASVDMRYSTNCGATTTWALGDYIYLVGTIGADGLFYLDTTTWWSNALPTTNDGKLYIRLGLSLTAAGYTMSFFDDRPIFYHDGTGIKEYKVADNKQDVISDLAAIRSGASAGATAVQPGDLATVATSGSYNDLSNKPTIPAAQVNSDWNANSGVAQILNKPTLATVATSGSYNDLSNKPTIPTVNNPTITITQGGVTKGSFSLNQATGDTIALDAGGGGGSADIDNLTITENADQEIQAVAVIDQNTGIAKTWTGTMAEYEAIVTKDPETEYIITDDIGGSANAFRKEVSERNIGEIVYSSVPVTDSGLHLADGEVLDGTGIYKDFYDYMVVKSASAPEIFTTEASWQAEVAANGVCGKYVLDTSLVSIRLPKLKNKLLSDDAVIGNGMALGLTDGTKNAGLLFNSIGGLEPYTGNYGGEIGIVNSGSVVNTIKSGGVTTDPTKSGIEVASSVDIYCYVVVANTAKVPVQVDIDNIATELNACYAHRVVEFQEPTSANGYTWYRKYADGWVEQGGVTIGIANNSNVNVSLPITMSDTNYTVTIAQLADTSYFYTNQGGLPYNGKYTTYIVLTNRRFLGNESRGIDINWQVSGMAA